MTSADPRAPNFFLLGGAKCGTTSLYQFLRAHPDVFLPKVKETHFFSSDRFDTKGLGLYLADWFQGSEGFEARGEATPAYFHMGDRVAPRLLDALGPDLRFVVVLRDPVHRAWSHYLHVRRLGLEDRAFAEIVAQRESETVEDKMKWKSYYSDGLYDLQLRTWQEHFATEQFLIFLTDDLEEDPAGVAGRCFAFLGLREDVEVSTEHRSNVVREARFRHLARLVNRPTATTDRLKRLFPARIRRRLRAAINSWNRRPLSDRQHLGVREEETLRDAYAQEIKRLQRLIGRDLSHWLPRKDEPAGV